MISEGSCDGVVYAFVFILIGGVVRIADEKAVDTFDYAEVGELELVIEEASGEGYCFACWFFDGKHLGGSDFEAGVLVVYVRRLRVLDLLGTGFCCVVLCHGVYSRFLV